MVEAVPPKAYVRKTGPLGFGGRRVSRGSTCSLEDDPWCLARYDDPTPAHTATIGESRQDLKHDLIPAPPNATRNCGRRETEPFINTTHPKKGADGRRRFTLVLDLRDVRPRVSLNFGTMSEGGAVVPERRRSRRGRPQCHSRPCRRRVSTLGCEVTSAPWTWGGATARRSPCGRGAAFRASTRTTCCGVHDRRRSTCVHSLGQMPCAPERCRIAWAPGAARRRLVSGAVLVFDARTGACDHFAPSSLRSPSPSWPGGRRLATVDQDGRVVHWACCPPCCASIYPRAGLAF